MIHDFLHFLYASPTTYHAAREISAKLEKAGFLLLDEKQKWTLEKGKSYYVVREGSLVVAFRIPQKEMDHAVILASHLDSPCLKLKPHPLDASHEIGRLNTEIYGSPLLHTWLDRDLALAGKLTYLTKKDTIQSQLVHLKDAPITIPNIALHLDRSIGEKGLLIQKQDHLKAIFSLNAKKKDLESFLKKECPFKTLLSFDLFLVPLEKPSLIGFDQELIASYRLDNLSSAYAACDAIKTAKMQSDILQMAVFWDHEEVGSVSCLGADSSFMDQIFKRISYSLKMDEEKLFQMKSRSLCISGDLAHGFHPNFPEKYDKENAPLLGKGVVLKFNANQKYATSSVSAARIVLLAQQHKIPLQKFASRSDIPSGSTVGSMMAAQMGISTVDLGIGSLAMHSIREVIAASDETALCTLLKVILEHA